MTVSVRMDPLLERELEQAAKRQGMTKSQFVIDAVKAALGRTPSPFELLQKVEQEMAVHRNAETARPRRVAATSKSHDDRLREALRAKHEADLRDWAKYHGIGATTGTTPKKARKTRR
jgi:hypothetical protein